METIQQGEVVEQVGGRGLLCGKIIYYLLYCRLHKR